MTETLGGRFQLLAGDLGARRHPAVIAVDGVDGSSKTTFASHLARAIDGAGRPAVVVHEDDFLAPRETRYRLGRDSPEDSFGTPTTWPLSSRMCWTRCVLAETVECGAGSSIPAPTHRSTHRSRTCQPTRSSNRYPVVMRPPEIAAQPGERGKHTPVIFVPTGLWPPRLLFML